MSNSSLNSKIREHVETLDSWKNKEMVKTLYKWFDLFNQEFFNNKLDQCVISLQKQRVNNLGHYHTEINDIGLQDNINLNSKNIHRPMWDILFTLLHEQVHQYQRRLGSFSVAKENPPKNPNYHNKEFLQMTSSFGLHHNKKGQKIKAPDGRFVEFLKKHGVEVTETDCKDVAIFKGKSKLIKYSCECTPPINIRVAVSHFSAICNLCKAEFKKS